MTGSPRHAVVEFRDVVPESVRALAAEDYAPSHKAGAFVMSRTSSIGWPAAVTRPRDPWPPSRSWRRRERDVRLQGER